MARWKDPYSAMAELEAIHRRYWIAATAEEFHEYCRSHPEYIGGMPLFVTDNLANYRKLGDDTAFQKVFDHAPDYVEAIRDYVTQFPMDTPLRGEVPGN